MKFILILLILNERHSINTSVNSFWDTEYHCNYIGRHMKVRYPDKVMGYICQPAQETQIDNYSIGDRLSNQTGHGG